jgi:hypothetical protein
MTIHRRRQQAVDARLITRSLRFQPREHMRVDSYGGGLLPIVQTLSE